MPSLTNDPMSNPYDRVEAFIRHLARIAFDLGKADVACITVDLNVPPAGVHWIGAPAGYRLAKRLQQRPELIAQRLADEGVKWCPGFWAYAVAADRGYVNVRWAPDKETATDDAVAAEA